MLVKSVCFVVRCRLILCGNGNETALNFAFQTRHLREEMITDTSENIERLKQEICDVGHRLYQKGFAAGNDGNITVRLNDNRILCTPTWHSKGRLQPSDIVTIDMTGEHISGSKKRSSEALLHLAIYQACPKVNAVVHCHPPHATAFAFTHQILPRGISPEIEMFLGDVRITPYQTPGTAAFASSIVPYLSSANALILANHGTVSYAQHLEQAYWWTEVLDAYCRTLILAKSLGPLQPISAEQLDELQRLKARWADQTL